MQQITLTLPRPHTGRTMGGQQRIINEMRRYNVLDCGRRFGKTDLCEILVSKPILDGYPVGWFAPTYKILDDAWEEIKRLYRPITKSKDETGKVLTAITGGSLEMWSMDKEGAGVSRKYKRVVIDEAARVKGLFEKFNTNIRPTLLDYGGDAFFPSTPKGLNDFHKLWVMADNDPDWMRWQMPTSENPYISLTEIDAMRESMPARVARQELDAEFLEDGSFFQGVNEVCKLTEFDDPEQHKGHSIVAGLDWALSEDFTRLTIFCANCKKAVEWYGVNKIDFTMQRMAIVDRLNKWHAAVLPERNSFGQPNIESLMSSGVSVLSGPDEGRGFNTTASSKPTLIYRLASAIESKEILLPAEYADELRAYEVTISTSPNPRFGAPDGMHDDRVISAALAWWAANTSPRWYF